MSEIELIFNILTELMSNVGSVVIPLDVEFADGTAVGLF